MKNKIKTILYTSSFTLVLLSGFFLISSFSNISNSSNLTVLNITSKDAEMAIDKLKDFEYFRSPYVSVDTINNLEMLHYIFDNLDQNDYEIRRIQPLGTVCQVTDKVSFLSEGTCRILVINNDRLNNYRNKLFKYSKEFEYVDFTYNGYNCINDNGQYYCLIEDYENKLDYKSYSLVDKLYEEDNKVILYEYYLIYRDSECSTYFSDLYCNGDGEIPEINEDIIRKYGVYYCHEFVIENNEINLEKSFIVNE